MSLTEKTRGSQHLFDTQLFPLVGHQSPRPRPTSSQGQRMVSLTLNICNGRQHSRKNREASRFSILMQTLSNARPPTLQLEQGSGPRSPVQCSTHPEHPKALKLSRRLGCPSDSYITWLSVTCPAQGSYLFIPGRLPQKYRAL